MKLLYSLLFSILFSFTANATIFKHSGDNRYKEFFGTSSEYTAPNGYKKFTLTCDNGTYSNDDYAFNYNPRIMLSYLQVHSTRASAGCFEDIGTSCPSGTFDDGTGFCVPPPPLVCTPPQIPDANGSFCIDPPECDINNQNWLNEDCNGDGIPNGTDPEEDYNRDGIPNKCDTNWMHYDSADCDGDSIPNFNDTDDDGDGIPDALDSDKGRYPSGDEIEGSPTCEELEAIGAAKCLINMHQFSCKISKSGMPFVEYDFCKSLGRPCDIVENNMKSTCNLLTHNLEGTCHDDGITVTANTYKCLPKPPDVFSPLTCRLSQNKVVNATQDGCVCSDGYTENSFGSCWKDLPPDATPEEIEEDEDNQQIFNESETEKIEIENQLKADSEALANTNTNIADNSNLLAGIRKDIQVNTEKLGALAADLSSDSNLSFTFENIDAELEARKTFVDNVLEEYGLFYENINTQMDTVTSQYDNAKGLFESDYTFSIPSGSSSNCLSFSFHGKTITFDLCTSLSLFAPIVYFITTIVMMIATFRFMITHILRGIE